MTFDVQAALARAIAAESAEATTSGAANPANPANPRSEGAQAAENRGPGVAPGLATARLIGANPQEANDRPDPLAPRLAPISHECANRDEAGNPLLHGNRHKGAGPISRISRISTAPETRSDGEAASHPPAAPAEPLPDITGAGRVRTWTGRVVSLDAWRRLSAWDRQGPNGRHWDGRTALWEWPEDGGVA